MKKNRSSFRLNFFLYCWMGGFNEIPLISFTKSVSQGFRRKAEAHKFLRFVCFFFSKWNKWMQQMHKHECFLGIQQKCTHLYNFCSWLLFLIFSPLFTWILFYLTCAVLLISMNWRVGWNGLNVDSVVIAVHGIQNSVVKIEINMECYVKMKMEWEKKENRFESRSWVNRIKINRLEIEENK